MEMVHHLNYSSFPTTQCDASIASSAVGEHLKSMQLVCLGITVQPQLYLT
jgi:hypothetical protein